MERDKEIIQGVLVWLEENIDRPLRMDDVASRAGYSKWHLQRMFARVMNVSLGKYIRNKKLECAAHDLLSSDATLSDISFKYGFDSQQSFSRSFSRKYKIPPGKFRGR